MTTTATAPAAPVDAPALGLDKPVDRDIMLVDLSSIAHPIWHMSASEPDPNWTSTQIVARVRALASGRPYVAICCDKGRSFRKDLNATYKAQRPEHEATLHHQIDLAIERLKADGFPVWAVPGFEADDLIASATARTLATPELTVTIVSSDKDLLQLVSERVSAKSPKTGDLAGPSTVIAKFGVKPEQMRDYLTLVGDASDNIKGCPGIGEKTAAKLLQAFGSLDAMYVAFDKGATPLLTPNLRTKLQDFRPHVEGTRALIALRADVDIPFEEVGRERVPTDVAVIDTITGEELADEDPLAHFGPAFEDSPTRSGKKPAPESVQGNTARQVELLREAASSAAGVALRASGLIPPRESQPPQSPATPAVLGEEKPTNGNGGGNGQALARRPEIIPASPEWGLQLEPRSMNEAIALANNMHASRLFSQYGTPQAVLATVMAGREFGMQAMASLRAFHVIEGRPTLAADAIRALVLKSGKAKFFRCIERTPERATFETHRCGDPEPIRLTFTISEGRQAFTKGEDAWNKSGWGKNPADMLIARAGAKLARLVYPDVMAGLYAREELE